MTRPATLNDLYRYLLAFKRENDGVPPTRREMVRALGFSSTSVLANYLRALEESGLIELGEGEARMIKIVGAEWRPPGG